MGFTEFYRVFLISGGLSGFTEFFFLDSFSICCCFVPSWDRYEPLHGRVCNEKENVVTELLPSLIARKNVAKVSFRQAAARCLWLAFATIILLLFFSSGFTSFRAPTPEKWATDGAFYRVLPSFSLVSRALSSFTEFFFFCKLEFDWVIWVFFQSIFVSFLVEKIMERLPSLLGFPSGL